MTHDDEQRQLETIRTDLVTAYAGKVSEEEISEHFDSIVASFQDAAVRTFIPVLTHRRMKQELGGRG